MGLNETLAGMVLNVCRLSPQKSRRKNKFNGGRFGWRMVWYSSTQVYVHKLSARLLSLDCEKAAGRKLP